MQNIGVIGMGAMGAPMALNLLKAGFAVTVFNRTRSKFQPLADAGATIADSITQLSADGEAVIIMVNDDDAVRQVAIGESGVLAGARPGLLVVDSTTIHPLTSQTIAATLAEHHVAYLDAPVMSDNNDAGRAEPGPVPRSALNQSRGGGSAGTSIERVDARDISHGLFAPFQSLSFAGFVLRHLPIAGFQVFLHDVRSHQGFNEPTWPSNNTVQTVVNLLIHCDSQLF